MLKNIANFNNINDYLPLFNAVLITDLFVILLLNTSVIKSQVLHIFSFKMLTLIKQNIVYSIN